MMADIWARLRDCLASIESSTSMLEVTPDYAAHFFDMYVKNHDGKPMTGDRIKILLLNLQKAESCDPRHDAIPSTSLAIVFGIKPLR
jgi:hypothetical protein